MCNTADQSTTAVPCEQSCSAMGFSVSLGCHPSKADKHQCYCDQATATSCTEGMCGGGNALAECMGNTLSVKDCEQECQAMGTNGECTYSQVTSQFSCNCLGGACIEGATFCMDPQTQMRCTSGAWAPEPCSDEACQAKVCEVEFANCPADYHAETLGCGYDGFYGDMGCLCTN